jgi:hypothetical protein
MAAADPVFAHDYQGVIEKLEAEVRGETSLAPASPVVDSNEHLQQKPPTTSHVEEKTHKEAVKMSEPEPNFYPQTPKGGASMTPDMIEKIDRDKAPLESVELPRESFYGEKTLDVLQIGQLPVFLHDKIKTAHEYGHLPKTLSFYLGTLEGLGLIDSSSLRALTDLRKQVSGDRQADEKVLPDIIKIVDRLRPGKRQ